MPTDDLPYTTALDKHVIQQVNDPRNISAFIHNLSTEECFRATYSLRSYEKSLRERRRHTLQYLLLLTLLHSVLFAAGTFWVLVSFSASFYLSAGGYHLWTIRHNIKRIDLIQYKVTRELHDRLHTDKDS